MNLSLYLSIYIYIYTYIWREMQWTPRTTSIYPPLCAFAGMCAGQLSIYLYVYVYVCIYIYNYICI